MSLEPLGKKEPSTMVRHFARQLIESYLDSDVADPTEVEQVKEYYENGELLRAVKSIQLPDQDD